MITVTRTVPSGASYRQVAHYGQIIKSGIFQKYDHGPVENLKLYGTTEPPEYNFANIRTKFNILYGSNDIIVMKEVSLLFQNYFLSS